jgi:hypothetical protein
MQLRRFLTLGLALALGGCALHEPLDPSPATDAGSATGGSAITGGGGGGGAIGGGGGAGTGGVKGSGGAVDGGADVAASGGHSGSDAGKDVRPVDMPGPMCGPVCAIFCPNGNVLDDNGCPTCRCKPVICPAIACVPVPCPAGFATDADGCPSCTCKPVACDKQECGGPPPGAPSIKCDDGSIAGPVCERNKSGQCSWVFRQCPDVADPCAKAADAAACATLAACRWLEPGCVEPKLAAAGCFTQARIGCAAEACAGKTCQKRVIDPCSSAHAPSLVAPPKPGCTVCGETIAICL